MYKIRKELVQAIVNYIAANSTGNVTFGQAYQLVTELQKLEKLESVGDAEKTKKEK